MVVGSTLHHFTMLFFSNSENSHVKHSKATLPVIFNETQTGRRCRKDKVLGAKRMVTVSTEVLGSGSASEIISVYQHSPFARQRHSPE